MVAFKAPQSKPEETLADILKADGYTFERQFKFHPDRNFKADFLIHHPKGMCHPAKVGKLMIEVEGATRGKPGHHQRVDGIDYDCRRISEAMLLGYTVLRVSRAMILDNTVSEWLLKYYAQGIGK